MKILVTGGNGFVGTHLIKKLNSMGHTVTSLSRPKKHENNTDSNEDSTSKNIDLNCINLDLIDYDINEVCLAKQFDVIIHLASVISVFEMIKNPKPNLTNNINSTLNLLEDIRLNNPDCLLIYASSDKVYGNSPKELVTENDINIPVDPYGSSKLISELLIKSYQMNYDLKNVILRMGNIFGPGQSAGLFIPSVISRIANDKKEIVVGSLEAYRNFVYINDVIDAFVKSISNNAVINEIFNIAAYNLKIAEVLEEIVKIGIEHEKKSSLVQDQKLFRKSEKGARRIRLDCKKAQEVLKWQPQQNFEIAMKETFESYLNSPSNLQSN